MVLLEERKTAAEYFRRQQLLDVERRTLRFQATFWGILSEFFSDIETLPQTPML